MVPAISTVRRPLLPFACWAVVALFGCGEGPDDTGAPAGEVCGNGVDDDGNGDSDCGDAACFAQCPETCDNGVDDNADFLVDCGDPGCVATCDADADGHHGEAYGGLDCDDTDPEVYPGATEIYHDGVDGDCDPTTVDDDEDGDGSLLADDCDDTDASAYPGAEEVCGDGIVNGCGADPPPLTYCYGARSLATADYRFDGSEADGHAGEAVSAAGDPDRDGNLDLVIGAPDVGLGGAAYLLEAPFPRSGDLRSIACELTAGIPDADFGSAVGMLDAIDTEQGNEVGIGSRLEGQPGNRSGAVYVMTETCTAGAVQASAFELSGVNKDEFGTSFSAIGDLDGDGPLDLAVGAPRHEEPDTDVGQVLVFTGPINGPLTPEDAWSVLTATEISARLGEAVAGTGDLDGDGRDDLAVSAPFTGLDDAGEVYVVLEAVAGITPVTDHIALGLGTSGDQFGNAIATWSGDLTGDGGTDLVVAAELADSPGLDSGSVLVIDDVTTGSVAATLGGAAAGDGFGGSVTVLRDVDGDGERDLAVGAPYADNGAEMPDAGAVTIFFGPLVGLLSATSADIVLAGEGATNFAGTAVASAGDIDLDGRHDLLVGAPSSSASFSSAGTVYLLTFGY